MELISGNEPRTRRCMAIGIDKEEDVRTTGKVEQVWSSQTYVKYYLSYLNQQTDANIQIKYH